MTKRTLLAAALALSAACNTPATQAVADQDAAQSAPAAAEAASARLAEIERRTGGRLGVALADAEGRILLAHRGGERFAMCSTFKLPLASMALDGAEDGRWRLDERLPLTRADIIPNSSISERHVAVGSISIEDAAAAVVLVSDNAAANLMLRRFGGPEAFTAWVRANGDAETRLDRFEMAMNENARGDPRDATTPRAAAAMTARMIGPGMHDAPNQARLRRWMEDTRTGVRRIRAGLPAGWAAGDKTGTCGTAYNDVAWFRTPEGRIYILAIYLDRPTEVEGSDAEAVLADVAREVVKLLQGTR